MGQSADVVLDGTFETLNGTITAVTGTDELSTGNLLVRTVTIRVNNAGGLTTAQALPPASMASAPSPLPPLPIRQSAP